MRKFITLGSTKNYVLGFDEEGKYFYKSFPRSPLEDSEALEELRKVAEGLNESNMEINDRLKVVGWADQIFNSAESFEQIKEQVEKDGGKMSRDLSALKVPGGDDSGLRLVMYKTETDVIRETQYGLWEEL